MMAMHRLALRFVVVSGLLAVACGDDGDDGGGDDTTGGTTAGTGMTAPGTSTTPMDTTEGMDASTTTAPGTTTEEPPGTSTGPGEDDSTGSDTGGTLDGTVLQNDAWTPTESIVFQTWPNRTDCWASTFEPSAEHYPFDLVGAVVAIGNAKGTFTFEVGVWEVDNQGMPETEIDATTVDIVGDTADLTEIDFTALGLTVPAIDSGDFAIVMCHTEHMGEPTIAIDADGTVSASNNWVYQQAMGEWVASPDFFGIDGDFILRAVIQPQG
jgi:hypothetical protein